MGLGQWLKRTLGAIAFATGSVERTALGQDGGADLGNLTKQHRRHRQGSLADALTQGEVTQQVQELRWRMYEVLDKSQDYTVKVVGYHDDGTPITETTRTDFKEMAASKLSKIKVDDYDSYDLELVVNNDEIQLDGFSAMDGVSENITDTNTDINIDKEIIINDGTIALDEDLIINNDKTRTIGGISYSNKMSKDKSIRPIECTREFRPKFEIEQFTKKMNVRKISENERLLEFYVSKYPDQFDRKSRFFISEIGKAIKNPRMCDFLDLITVSFISHDTLGARNLHEFEYKINKFDKIIEFDGFYVIKFIGTVTKNGESVYEKYRDGAEQLIEKYNNIDRRDD